MPEFLRKKIVAFKRNPQIVSTLLICIACMIFTFSLGIYSASSVGLYQEAMFKQLNAIDPTFYVPGFYRNPAIYVFIVTLFSILCPITFLSVYKDGKVNWFMYSLVIGMLVLMIACDILYCLSIGFYTGPVWNQQDTTGIYAISVTRTIVHICSLAICIISILLKPVLEWLLNLIDTTVADEYDLLMEKADENSTLDLDDVK